MKQITTWHEYELAYKQSIEQPESFWAAIAESFVWKKKWDRVLDWNFEQADVKWFKGGVLNITENCIDRHLSTKANEIAFICEPNEPNQSVRKITYQELHDKVCQLANGLKSIGVKKGTRVCIYMPMIGEGAIAMLACARIGAIHSVVFAGFSAASLSSRINDASCEFIITADSFYRADKKIELKKIVDEALLQTETIKKCIVYNHSNDKINWQNERDIFWNELVTNQEKTCLAEPMQSESPLFILYTSGSTGSPKGVLHTTAGYMLYIAYTFLNVFNYRDKEVFFCTADIGWVTGHSYVVYAPLLNGATSVIFEGTPTYPDHGRFWDIIAKHSVNIFYTAPTAIRSLESFGSAIFENKKLSSLRVLGSVGEPINEEAWRWYSEQVGKNNCPIVDTWWQTETGGILISPIATVTPLIPAFATFPLPGVQAVLLNQQGNEILDNDAEGSLCIKFPWPGMARTVYGNHERFKQTYFTTFKSYYFTGDGAKRDQQGNYRITGRIDDVINISGHRIGTGELEDAIDQSEYVIESAVVGYPHDIKGQAVFAFVVCEHLESKLTIENSIKKVVTDQIGSFAKPDKIRLVRALPKTRSGKIMRRILRKIAEGNIDNLGDTTTLLDSTVVQEIVENIFEEKLNQQ